MRKAHHNATRMAQANVVERGRNAYLHFGKTFTVGKTKRTWRALHGFPFRKFHEVAQFPAGPFAKVTLDEAFVDDDLLLALFGKRCCSFTRALKW